MWIYISLPGRLVAHLRKRRERYYFFYKIVWGCFSKEVKFVIYVAFAIIHCGLWRHMLTPLHILSSATIHIGTVGMYCCPYAYIVTGINNQAKRATIMR